MASGFRNTESMSEENMFKGDSCFKFQLFLSAWVPSWGLSFPQPVFLIFCLRWMVSERSLAAACKSYKIP